MRIDPSRYPEDPERWRPDLPVGDNADLMRWYAAWVEIAPPAPVCVEIGVAYGRSLLWLASCLRWYGHLEHVLYGVDPWGIPPPSEGGGGTVPTARGALGCLYAHGTAEELARIRLIGVPSLLAARIWTPESLDLVMIDGDHTYPRVLADIDAYLPLIRPGGVLAGHDYGDQYPGVAQAVDELLGRRVHHYQRVWWVEYPAA